MGKTIWHPASELPSLHEESFEEDGEVIKSTLSDWMLVIDDTCADTYDDPYTPPMRVAHYVKCGSAFQWEDGSGPLKTVTRWAFPTELLEKQKARASMKQIRITYSWHENREFSAAEEHTSSFALEVEDEIFADCIGQQTPYRFNWTKTRRQYHVAELAYWHAAMHGRYIMSGDQILSIKEV